MNCFHTASSAVRQSRAQTAASDTSAPTTRSTCGTALPNRFAALRPVAIKALRERRRTHFYCTSRSSTATPFSPTTPASSTGVLLFEQCQMQALETERTLLPLRLPLPLLHPVELVGGRTPRLELTRLDRHPRHGNSHRALAHRRQSTSRNRDLRRHLLLH